MAEEYQIVYEDKPAWGIIGGGISTYNAEQAGDDSGEYLCLVLRAPNQEIAGGVIGVVHYGWLYIQLMWIQEGLRGRGYGRRLLSLAEDEGRRRGARNAYLDTFSFQAPGFYQRLGYQVFGELRDFPTGHQRYYLAKEL